MSTGSPLHAVRDTVTRLDEIAQVRAALQHYALRGSFRAFSEVGVAGGKAEFHFTWFRDFALRVVFD